MMKTSEEFVYATEWSAVVRLSQFVAESCTREKATKMIREHKRGRPLFRGPYGEKSEWAAMCRNWYRQEQP
jgi:hypothetical protein